MSLLFVSYFFYSDFSDSLLEGNRPPHSCKFRIYLKGLGVADRHGNVFSIRSFLRLTSAMIDSIEIVTTDMFCLKCHLICLF